MDYNMKRKKGSKVDESFIDDFQRAIMQDIWDNSTPKAVDEGKLEMKNNIRILLSVFYCSSGFVH